MNCRNCSQTFKGNYCSNCGEKAVHEKFTLKNMIYNAIVVPFKEHRQGLPLTLKDLTIKPGDSIRNYIEGDRSSLYAADKFLLLAGALTIILNFRYHFFVNEFSNSETTFNQTILSYLHLQNETRFFVNFFKYSEEYATVVNVIAIPVFAFFSFIFFKKNGYKFGEDLVLNTYITAQQLFFLIFFVPPVLEFFPQLKDNVIAVYTLLIMLYNILIYMQFFKEKNFIGFSKSLIAVIVSQVMTLIVNVLIYYSLGKYFQLLEQYKVI
jgi:hypothetical protein